MTPATVTVMTPTATGLLIAATARANGWTTRFPEPAAVPDVVWKRDGETLIVSFSRHTGRLLAVQTDSQGEWKGARKTERLLARLAS